MFPGISSPLGDLSRFDLAFLDVATWGFVLRALQYSRLDGGPFSFSFVLCRVAFMIRRRISVVIQLLLFASVHWRGCCYWVKYVLGSLGNKKFGLLGSVLPLDGCIPVACLFDNC
jgi:hypothetical protein